MGRLRGWLVPFILLLAALSTNTHGAETDDGAGVAERAFRTDVVPFLETFCIRCHGGTEPKAELRLDNVSEGLSVSEHREQWQAVVEMVQLREMPPDDQPKPGEEAMGRFLSWLKYELAQFDCSQHRHPGRVTIRRLNRAEYNNTIRDLIGVDSKPAENFPADDVGNGFDNMGDVLSLSPILMEKYLSAAKEIITRAMDQPALRERMIPYRPSQSMSRDECARRVLAAFAARAFRRPVTDDELGRLTQLVKLAEDRGADFQVSLEYAWQAVLASPHFLYRIELDADPQDLTKQRKLTDYELATRLSYFLWSSMPDDELFSLARQGKLNDDAVLAAQVRRMLRDQKINALVENFAGQWLQLRSLSKVAPDPGRYPDFDEQLRSAMRQETELFCAAIIQEDRSILDFLDSDYTFVNERLARHYGIDGISGEKFRRVNLEKGRRGGVLTQASILTLTSNPTRTSPVKRGKWILENILGTPPPPPPPGVEELAEDDEAELLGSLRERMEQHRADPSCSVCHKNMDALGFGFENFDAIGAWRDRDGRFDIDPSGELPGNQTFAGPRELRTILRTGKKEQFVRCLTEKLLAYALGRGLEPYDRCAEDDIVASVEENDYRISSLIMSIVQSDPFRLRGSTGEEK